MKIEGMAKEEREGTIFDSRVTLIGTVMLL
jgi:hypothetical protein